MTYKDFKEGMLITCKIYGYKIDDAKLHYEKGIWFICHNDFYYNGSICKDRLGYEYSWALDSFWDDGDNDVTDIQLKVRTIDDLEEGDIIVDKDGYNKKCLAKCGEVYALSYTWEGDTANQDKKFYGWQTIYQLKDDGFTLYQEPTTTDETIEIEGTKYKASEVKEALKNFKK